MKTFTTPGEVTVDPSDNPISALLGLAAEDPDLASLAYRDGDRFVDVTAADFAARVEELAAGLVALGIEKGSRIGLFSATRMEFTILDYAIWAAGCATVTIYETSSAEQVQWIMGNSEAVGIFCETAGMKAVYDEVAAELPAAEHVFVIEDGALDQIASLATEEARAEVANRIAAIDHDDLATLVYTSGTTGRPKGCVITHGNFIWTVRQVEAVLGELTGRDQRQLMFLPLAHIFARLVQVVCVSAGVKIGYSTGIPNLTEELAIFKPTWVFSVPRVFEKIYNAAKLKADDEGKGKIFDLAAGVAIAYSKGLQAGKVPLAVKAQHALFDKLVYGKLRAVFGGEMRYAISGGAALGARLGHFFRGLGITPLEGYGLTETTAASTVNPPDAVRIGTVGRPLPGVTVGIADDGEVMIRGKHIFKGYWRNEAATKEALEPDGWFHSGDIGVLDDAGYLSITGRKKELIVTAGGKNVAPAVLEDRLRSDPLVSQAMVVGDAKPFIAALIAIDAEALPAWAHAHGKSANGLADLIDDPDLRAEIDKAIAYANKAVSKAEAIKTYRILPRDLSIEGDELTPTLKVKRSVVAAKYADLIADIYGD